MNILLVSQYFWPERFRVNDLVTGWEERGHQVTILTGIPNYPVGKPYPGYSAFGPASERFGRSRVVRVPLIPRGGGGALRMASNYLSFAISASLLGPLRCRGPFDLVFVFQMSPVTMAIPAALMRFVHRAPMVMWVQDLWPETLVAAAAVRSHLLLGLVGRLVRGLYRRSELVLVQAEEFTSSVVERGAAAERVRYLPNWAESFYRPVPVEAGASALAELPQGFVILFAGNLGEVQSLETALAAAEHLRDLSHVHWVFMGDGRRRAWLVEEIVRRGLGGNVHWMRMRPAEEMPAWLSAADALLITLRDDPALARTLPGKLQSCLACGRPVLAALGGAGAEVVRRAGAGLVGPAGDVEALAKNARELVAAPAEARARMGLSGREYFLAHFERELLLDRLEGWMREVVPST
ncbi:MAG: glycosyltransferase family 4 protein [Thermoanaerobaculia bacterium]